VFRNVGI